MSWLLPSLIATLTSTSLLLTVYLTLWFRYRRPHLAWWSGCWAAYVAVITLVLVQALGARHAALPVLQQILALSSALLLFKGILVFVGRGLHPAWLAASSAVAAWTLLGQSLDAHPSWLFTPMFLFIGLLQAVGGVIILRFRRGGARPSGAAHGLAGWAMILWGLHRADYPFLKDVEWFAPFGFLIASALTVLVALALLVLFFEELSQEIAQAKDALQESEQTLDSILAAAPVGIGLLKNRRVIWANQTAYRLTGYPPGSWIGQDLTALYAAPEEYQRVGSVVYGQLAAFGYGSEQTVLRKSDGTLLHCQIQVLPLDPEDHDQGLIFALTDLSARKAMEDELRRTSRTLRAIQECQRAMLHAQDEVQLMGEVCRIVCETGGYRLAWVGLLGGGQGDEVAPAAQWGYEDGYLETAAISASGEDARGRGPLGEALRSGLPRVVQDVHSDPSFAPWREEALKRGYASVLGLPLLEQGRAFGVLGIYAREPHAFNQEEVGFLEGLAHDLAFGLGALRFAEARRLAQTLVDTSPDTIMLIANGGFIVACNQAVARRLGKSVDELVGTQVADHVPPEVGARRKQAGLRVLATGQPLEFQEEARGRMFEYRMHPVADRDGKPRYVAVYARDVTERVDNERALKSSIDNYRTLTQHSLQGIAILESDPTHFAYVNPRMTDIFGYSAEEFDALGPDEMWKLVHADDRDMVRWRAESRLAGQTPPPRYEFRILRKDGGTRWVEVFSAPTEHRGKPASQLAYIDITERKQAEEALRESEEKFSTAFKNSPVLMAITNMEDGAYLEVNDRFLEVAGLTREETLGNTSVGVGWLKDEDRARLLESLGRHGRVDGMEIVSHTKQGVPVPCIYHCEPIFLGGKSRLLAIALDITERKRAEEALRKAEAKYRMLVDTTNDGIVVAQDGKPVFFNQRMQEITGYSAEEYVGQPFIEFVHPEDRPLVMERYRRRVAGENAPTAYDFRLLNKQGQVRWLFINSSQIEWDGRPATLNTFTDLTPRKQAEDALRESQESYRRIVETAQEGVWAADRHGVTTYVNRRVVEMTGYPLEGLIGRNISSFMAVEEMPDHEGQMALRRRLESSTYERKFIRRDGSEFWAMISAVPQISSEGEYNGSFAMLIDITERKRTERALRESEQRFRLLAENSSDLVCLHDLNLVINYVSPSSARLLGYAQEELQGRNIQEFLHPEDAAAVVEIVARGARGGIEPPLRNENRLRKKDGSYVWVESLASPVLDDSGGLKYLLVVSRDITERKNNETTLLQMAAGVAHNFNNVLMAIMSNAQAAQTLLGRSRRQGGDLRALLNNVVQGARSGRDVVQRLSRYVGGSRGRLDSQEVVDVGRLLRSLRRLVAGMGRPAQEAPVEMSLDLGRGLTVRGAGGELTEVFLNLAKNAMEAMPQGGRLEICGRVENGQVVTTFTDQGPGVDEQTLGRFFEPFFTTKGVAGQGLGLTVSRAIVAAHGGQMEAQSRPGQGTTLTVRLPLAQAQASPALPLAAERTPGSWPLRVLLVEDEALVALGIVATLRKAGHQTLHSSTLAQAVEDLPGFQPDLILCDLGLPDGSGWEVCSRLAREAALAGLENTPLVVLSGWSSEQIQRQRDEACQPAAYLQKPVESARLLQVLALAAPGGRTEPETLD